MLQRDPHEAAVAPIDAHLLRVGRRREELGLAARHEHDRRAAPQRQPDRFPRHFARAEPLAQVPHPGDDVREGVRADDSFTAGPP